MPESRRHHLTLVLSSVAILLAGLVVSAGHSSRRMPSEVRHLESPIDFEELEIIDVPVDALAVMATFETPIAEVEIPAYAQRLAGRRVRLRGMMYPPFQETGFTQWVFIPETHGKTYHLFASKIPLHGLILVTTASGHTEDYTSKPVTIEGTFDIQIDADEEGIYQFYVVRHARIVEKNTKLRGHPIGGFGC